MAFVLDELTELRFLDETTGPVIGLIGPITGLTDAKLEKFGFMLQMCQDILNHDDLEMSRILKVSVPTFQRWKKVDQMPVLLGRIIMNNLHNLLFGLENPNPLSEMIHDIQS